MQFEVFVSWSISFLTLIFWYTIYLYCTLTTCGGLWDKVTYLQQTSLKRSKTLSLLNCLSYSTNYLSFLFIQFSQSYLFTSFSKFSSIFCVECKPTAETITKEDHELIGLEEVSHSQDDKETMQGIVHATSPPEDVKIMVCMALLFRYIMTTRGRSSFNP